jgi:hypothetical protein
MKYKEWQKWSARFLSMTGYTIENFEALYLYFEEAHNEYLRTCKMTGKRRSGQRMYVMCSNTPFADIRECFAFILCYLKNNPMQEMQTDLNASKDETRKLLTEQQEAENRKISSVRVHVIGSMKRGKIVKDECRLRTNDFVKHVLHTCAALHNSRVKLNPFQYEFN